jgi:predicted dehydrogenase
VTDPLRVALVGCGALAEILADRVLPRLRDDVVVVAAVDVDEGRARRMAGRLGARSATSVAAACAPGDVEALDVRLPHHLHVEGARLAASAGLPFLMEKPMATSLGEAREIAAIGGALHPACGVGENYGFLEPVRAARALLDDGAIGELLAAQATRVFELGEEWRRDGWRVGGDDRATGVVVDQATHVARLLRTVVGEIEEVSAQTSSRRAGWAGADSAAVSCRLTSGVVATQTLCWASPTPAVMPELGLFGSAGSIEVHVAYDTPGGGALLQRPGEPERWSGTGTSYYDSLGGVLVDWAHAVRAGVAPSASLEEGVRDAAVMAAVLESAAHGGDAVAVGAS